MRDDFSPSIKDLLAKRVGYHCSNPNCKCLTSGPQENPGKSINVGVASHITAASAGGPRFDSALTPEEREASANGIWLCQKCGKLIDNDIKRYTVAKLFSWKNQAEQEALFEVEGGSRQSVIPKILVFEKLENLMFDLLEEMRTDLAKNSLQREFVLLKREWTYDGRRNELRYYYNDHVDLENKVRILENYNLVREITFNNTKRYLISEDLVEYLTS